MTGHTFTTVLELNGRTATGFEVPAEVMAALGSRRPAVVVTIGDHRYASTVGTMAGRPMVPVSAEHRAAAGIAAGEPIEVTLTADTEPRVVRLPPDLDALLAPDDPARTQFEALSPSQRKDWVVWIESAKKPETRQRRLEATVEGLRAGRKTH